MPLNNPATGFATFNTGSYTGDDSVNKAIPHGLGAEPTLVFITSNQQFSFVIAKGDPGFITAAKAPTGRMAVTQPNATNFYVGNAGDYPSSANQTVAAHAWTAVLIN